MTSDDKTSPPGSLTSPAPLRPATLVRSRRPRRGKGGRHRQAGGRYGRLILALCESWSRLVGCGIRRPLVGVLVTPAVRGRD